MTLVGTLLTSSGDFACFGDTVVSGVDGSNDVTFWSPLGHELVVPAGELGPMALVQKLVTIGSNCVLGWSGEAADAIALSHSLLAEVRDGRLASAAARAGLDAFAHRPGIGAFVAVNTDGAVDVHTIGSIQPYAAPGLQGFVAGSGASDFASVLPELVESIRVLAPGARVDARTIAAALLASLFAHDLQHGIATIDVAGLGGYGGAFEVAFAIDDRFAKLDNIGLVAWLAEPSRRHDGLRVLGPIRLMGQTYLQGGTLVCWSLEDLDPRSAPHRVRARTVVAPHSYAAPRPWLMEEEVAGQVEDQSRRYVERGELTIEPRLIIHVVVAEDQGIYTFTRANGDGFEVRGAGFRSDDRFVFWLRDAVTGGANERRVRQTRPTSIAEWSDLPILPFGTHVVANAGWLEARVADCRRALIADIPPPVADEHRLALALPTVTIASAAGDVVHRLPLPFGALVRRLHAEAGEWAAHGRRLLPSAYEFRLGQDGTAEILPR